MLTLPVNVHDAPAAQLSSPCMHGDTFCFEHKPLSLSSLPSLHPRYAQYGRLDSLPAFFPV